MKVLRAIILTPLFYILFALRKIITVVMTLVNILAIIGFIALLLDPSLVDMPRWQGLLLCAAVLVINSLVLGLYDTILGLLVPPGRSYLLAE